MPYDAYCTENVFKDKKKREEVKMAGNNVNRKWTTAPTKEYWNLKGFKTQWSHGHSQTYKKNERLLYHSSKSNLPNRIVERDKTERNETNQKQQQQQPKKCENTNR